MTPLESAKELYKLQHGGKSKRGRKPVFSANQFYPWKVERILSGELSSFFVEIGKRMEESALYGIADGIEQLENYRVPDEYVREIAERAFDETNRFQSDKLGEAIEKIAGVRVDFYANTTEIREDWIRHFMDTCKSTGDTEKKEIADEIYKFRLNPQDRENLVNRIREIEGKYSKTKAKFIARNETGNLNSAMQRQLMTHAGFSMYTWVSMVDGVTRDEHRSLNGMVCRWDDDSVYSDDGGRSWKSRKTAGMFVGQPGMDYNCRCTAVPFDPGIDGGYEVKEGEPYVGGEEIEPERIDGLTAMEIEQLKEDSKRFDAKFEEFVGKYGSALEKSYQDKDFDTLAALKAMEKYGVKDGSVDENHAVRAILHKDGSVNYTVSGISRAVAHQKFIIDHPLLSETTLTRGCYLDPKVINSGEIFADRIMSWSLSRTYSKTFLDETAQKGRKKCLLVWNAPKGAKVAPIVKRNGKNSFYSSKEMEFNSCFGKKYAIQKKEFANDKKIIYLFVREKE